jgi:TPR repeat protein
VRKHVLLSVGMAISLYAFAGFDEGSRAYQAGDFKTALREWQPLAEEGNAAAQNRLGLMYQYGKGLPKDSANAAEWYRKAANQGNAEAQCNLGVLYAQGDGVRQDEGEALAWFRKAADQGLARAQSNLGTMYYRGRGVAEDSEQALAWTRKAADQGHDRAQFNLALMYLEGKGVAPDAAQARIWFRKAADQGFAQAQTNVGIMYANGDGVPQDDEQAVAWYRKAANQGNAQGQHNLGVMYSEGRGVPAIDVAGYALLSISVTDQSVARDADKLRRVLQLSMPARELEAERVLIQEMSRPGNLLKALDAYVLANTSSQDVAALAGAKSLTVLGEATTATATSFDRIAAKKRYQDWYRRFQANFRVFAKAVGTDSLDAARVNKIFADSVVPDSRMIRTLLGFVVEPDAMRGSYGDPPVAARTYVMLRMMEHALPAGYGGPFRTAYPRASDAGSFIWYLHLHTNEATSDVFLNPGIFNAYHLPPYGVMERKAYPFISFCEVGGKLYVAGLSAELVDVVDATWHRQLY